MRPDAGSVVRSFDALSRVPGSGERADHCAIYLVIAGTPFGLVSLGQWWGATLVGAMCTLSMSGAALEIRLEQGTPPSLQRYLAMGWLAVLAAAPVIAALDRVALAQLLAGAACYSLGTVFYRNRRGWRQSPTCGRIC
ncbi:PAQR family membrane homeostasis protein TrhA [Variovorax sp. GT1P44]|uniref:PAQR family membrane homeostasis protein TrhA n=1 Tax=Variovorax sp. GT1P44 TaxID=3443742 RepID=UPI003F462A78